MPVLCSYNPKPKFGYPMGTWLKKQQKTHHSSRGVCPSRHLAEETYVMMLRFLEVFVFCFSWFRHKITMKLVHRWIENVVIKSCIWLSRYLLSFALLLRGRRFVSRPSHFCSSAVQSYMSHLPVPRPHLGTPHITEYRLVQSFCLPQLSPGLECWMQQARWLRTITTHSPCL